MARVVDLAFDTGEAVASRSPLAGFIRGELGADRARLDCELDTLSRSGRGDGELLDRRLEGHGPGPGFSRFIVAGRVESSSLSPDKTPAIGLVASSFQYGVLVPSAEEDKPAAVPALSSLPMSGTGREAVSCIALGDLARNVPAIG